jgi:hypothetical protein
VWAELDTDFYAPIEREVLQIADGRVRATYGEDSCRGRARKRATREWAVDQAK